MSGRYSERRECGCRITLVEDFGELVDIELAYCPKHKAAPWMYEALREVAGYPALSKLPPVMALDDMRRIARYGLALVDGDSDE